MVLKERPHHPPKRTAPVEAPESGYVSERRERRDAWSEMKKEIERLRSENQRLQEAEA